MKKEKDDEWKNYLQLGFEITFYVIFFVFGGYYLDIYFSTKPYLTLVGTIFSIIALIYVLWKRFR
jgi:F0F1-type ATP synthase assembly protein I